MAMLAEEKALYVVADPEHEEEVSFKNPIRELGFVQIEHILGLDKELSDGAYRTLSILHFFWHQKKSAYPGLGLLAKLRGKSERTITEHLAELTEKGIITRSRRMGTSSMTYLEDLPQSYVDAATAILEERAKKTARKLGRKLPVEQEKNFSQRIIREEEKDKEQASPPNANDSHEQTPNEMWNEIPSAKDAPITDNGLIPMLPEEKYLFDALNVERVARHYVPFVRFKTTKQRDKFRGCVNVFNGSTNAQIDEIIANGKTNIEGVVNALDWRRRNNSLPPNTIDVRDPTYSVQPVDMTQVVIR